MILQYSHADLDQIASQLLTNSRYKTWLFDAPMGAGKTTLIKALVKNLGVDDVANSPTFSIVNEYLTTNGSKVFHFDLYRLKNEEEVYDIGLDEYFDQDEWCFVEWPDYARHLLSDQVHTLSIRIVDEHTRELNFE